jgi:uncharacterized integral membrane protein
MVLTLIFAFVLAIAAAVFALQNPVMVEANFFGYAVQGSLALFVLIGLGMGLLIGILVMTPGRIKSSLANSRHRRKIVELESSIQKIQSAPYIAPEVQRPPVPEVNQSSAPASTSDHDSPIIP